MFGVRPLFFYQIMILFKLTLIGTVGMSLIAVISTVVVSITGPVLWNTAAAVAFKLHTGARVTAAGFITVIPAVVIWGHTHMMAVTGHYKSAYARHTFVDSIRNSPLSQRQLTFIQRPLAQVNWVSGKQVGYAGERDKREEEMKKRVHSTAWWQKENRLKFRYHKMVVHLSDRHNHHPGHKSRRQEYNGHWNMGTD